MRRTLRIGLRVALLALIVTLLVAWLQRERIAEDFITRALNDRGIEASYQIESIGPGKQVLRNIVIGNPDRPDLTVERVEVLIKPRLGLPSVTEVRVTRPRLYGSIRDGQPSFGALDPLLFTGEEGPFEFPDMRLVVNDGRGLLETDFGRVGLKLTGSGHLRGGFAGELAAIVPELSGAGCSGERVTLYGRVAIDAERPEFRGPLRIAALDCEGSGLAIRDAGVELNLQAERNLAEYEGDLEFAAQSVAVADVRGALNGAGRFTWHDNDLNVRYDLTASEADTPFAAIGTLTLEGRLRALDNFAQLEVEGDLEGEDMRMGPELDASLASARDSTAGTLIEPLLARIQQSLAQQLRGSTMSASFTARQVDDRFSVSIPEAFLRGGSGESLFALSRGQVAMGEGGLPLFSGNFQTGGAGLPSISGRMEQAGNGALELRMAMREYVAGSSSLALNEMRLLQGRGGELALNGMAIASGPLPGGTVSDLQVPLDALLSPDGSFSMWRGCRDVRFRSLTFASFALGTQTLTLCPQSSQPILRYGANGLQVAAALDQLDLAGALGGTPMRLRSGGVDVTWPGAIAARDLDIELGTGESTQSFKIADLRADFSGDSPGGDFSGANVKLASVPLDLFDASGVWTYSEDRLLISDGRLLVEDREAVDRFEPLVARDATLTLFDSLIEANALLREPVTQRAITRVRIVHDLNTSAGHADLFVENLEFDDDLQPAPSFSQCLDRPDTAKAEARGLTCLALGVVSNVEGAVSGTGRIDWNEEAVTSSGSFTTDGMDLAAAFGPVNGARGTIVFTDLLNFTTAPDQRLTIEAINPGIEVFDGEVVFQIRDAELLALSSASWPFMGGTLTMRPVDIRFGVQEVRSYVMVIDGLEASQFIETMDMGNLAASGVFDGVVPIIFDEDGNGRLEAGLLTSRPPGGHLAYVGELTYEDMGFFANYAFQALRDLSYDRMEVLMDGPLTGELVTQVRFDGIGQGETAESNIITRAIADLPIELHINIRAPFYKLMNSVRALYDPAAIRDPRSIGLLGDDGVRLQETVNQQSVDDRDAAEAAEAQRLLLEALEQNNSDIQPQESEPVP